MQLSAKALLRPFTSPAATDTLADDDDIPEDSDSMHDQSLGEDPENDDDDNDDVVDHGGETGGDEDNDDDSEDPFDGLEAQEREELMDNTAIVRTTLNKVRFAVLYQFSSQC
jgi:hypothetical protein